MGNWKLVARSGTVYDLHDDLYLDVRSFSGAGMAPIENLGQAWGLLPGEYHAGERTKSRTVVLGCVLEGGTPAVLLTRRAALIDLLKPDSAARSGNRQGTPLYLRYVGTKTVELPCYYAGGMEGAWEIDDYGSEKLALRFEAQDLPLWRATSDTTTALTTINSATARYVIGKFAGLWSVMGPPSSGGTVRALAEDATYIYVAGNFTNWNGDASSDYIVRYNKGTGVWSALGSGVDGIVYALAIGPDGRLYAGGEFTNAGGGAATRVAVWNGSTWAALGAGVDNTCLALAIGPDGKLYAGGTFWHAGGGGANRIAAWDGSAWAALGTGLDGQCNAIAVSPEGTVYAGGAFANAGGSAAAYIASWNGSAWAALGAGMNTTVRALVIGIDGKLYAGGDFTTAGGLSAARVAVWNGTAWAAMGTGCANSVYALAVAPNGDIYAAGLSGSFGYATSLALGAYWNGFVWQAIPHKTAATTVYALLVSATALVIGSDGSGTCRLPYANTITLSTVAAETYPRLTMTRAGGSSATLYSIRNETTGQELGFNLALLDGETITIDLTPGAKTVTSSFGRLLPGQPVRGSDFSTWRLTPGANTVNVFMDTAGSPTITANIIYRATYWAMDAAEA